MQTYLAIQSLAQDAERAVAAVSRARDLRPIDAAVLLALDAEDGQGAGQLSRAVGRPATSFTPILDSLEARALVVREGNPTDRRAVRVYLTLKGVEVAADLRAAMDALEAELSHIVDRFNARRIPRFHANTIQRAEQWSAFFLGAE